MDADVCLVYRITVLCTDWQLGSIVTIANITNGFAYSQPPRQSTYVLIDDQYAEYYEVRFNKKIDRANLLPSIALQGHPEPDSLWENRINEIKVLYSALL
jgi:hypothetical protein